MVEGQSLNSVVLQLTMKVLLPKRLGISTVGIIDGVALAAGRAEIFISRIVALLVQFHNGIIAWRFGLFPPCASYFTVIYLLLC